MPQHLITKLHRTLHQHQLENASFLLAYSGGLDSTVLLSLFAQLKQLTQFKLQAIHIHHGLSPNADHWAKHCQQQCCQLNIPLIIEKIQLNSQNNIEQAARISRYRAIKPHLQPDTLLVTAHHLNDQSETLLLALKRGSGIKGMAAMQLRSELWQMPIFRPLLDCSRQQLEKYAQMQHLRWIEDESNQDNHYDRNFLRNQILPKLRQRWPAIDRTLHRSAQQCYEQQQLLEELLLPLFKQHYRTDDHTLNITGFEHYSRPKQHFLLRLWLEQLNISMPSQTQLNELIDRLIFAAHDSQPQLQLHEYVIRRYQKRLYLTANYADLSSHIIEVKFEQLLSLPDQLGTIYFEPQTQGINVIWQQTDQQRQFLLPFPKNTEKIEIHFTYSGKVRLADNRANQDIKKIWQHAGIPPWQRQRTPLVFYANTLIAALGVFIQT